MEYVLCGNRMRPASWVTCANCGIEFLKTTVAVKSTNSHYCSVNCYRVDGKATVECENCGGQFSISNTRAKKSKSGLYFCSRKCKDACQVMGGVLSLPHYGRIEKKYRTLAFRNYEKRCVACGFDEFEQGLQVHHIDGDRSNNVLENLIVLCGTHHLLITFGCAKIIDRVYTVKRHNNTQGVHTIMTY